MKKVLILTFLCLVAALSALGQTTQNPLAVNISAASTDCSVANSCAWQLVNMSAGQTVVTLAGTFSGTFIVEQTNNGTTWTTAATLSSAGTTTYNQNGFTAIRVRCSAYTSGTAAVTVSTGTGGSSTGGGGFPVTTAVQVQTGGSITSTGSGTINATNGIAVNQLNAITGITGTTSVGTFVNGANAEYFQSVLTGGSSCTAPSTAKTDAITACINTPSSGVTNAFSDGIASYVFVNDPNQGGLFGKVEGVGAYLVCQANANNTKCIGDSPQVQDVAGKTGTFIEGEEVGVIPANTTTQGFGILMSFEGGNVQPTTDNMPAVAVQTPTGTGTFTSGFVCQAGSVTTPYCVEAGKISTAGASSSQYVLFTANNGSANISTGLNLLPGQVLANSATVPFASTAYATYMTATATLSANQLVKIDTAHADSVVVCTTTDTLCNGFVAETLINNCTASNTTCPIVTTPGSKVQGIVGTGTCAIGNYVIADTTTNGRVKCVVAQPPYWVGTALSVQGSVGSLVDVLTAFSFASTGTATNCGVSSASPAACGSAPAGSVAVPTAATTYTVNTTAVTANSQIFIQQDTSATLGTRLGVTCNTTVSTALPLLTAKVAGTSFTFSLTAPAVNPACFSYLVVN